VIQPRNTLVVLKVIEKSERKVSKIIVPTYNDCYAEAEVVAVGPGSISAAGGQSETFDLKVGQRVLVKHKKKMQRGPGDLGQLFDEGIPYRDGDIDFLMVEQSSVVGILAEAGDVPAYEAAKAAVSLN
jgi:co-chaperonin GroES (HSP10)